ncbi:MAG: hypothetical protein DRJ66_04680 [Thermoprotei archaeon]|nr:MAG: hypothetical protein DRJ66_04680 [Thermoprotei archaeon]RLF20084.1 MAG: hypothetical protein DRZ82_03520 [Thermoprotei archaeon]
MSLLDVAIGLFLIFILINLIGKGKVKSLAKELGEAFRAFQEGLYGREIGEKEESEEELKKRIKELEAEVAMLKAKLEESKGESK